MHLVVDFSFMYSYISLFHFTQFSSLGTNKRISIIQ